MQKQKVQLSLPGWLNTSLWGSTVALSWMWGLGLFFSVQFTSQFGPAGLLAFAIPNGLGLALFGAITHHIARRGPSSESLATFFTNWSRPFRIPFLLYQFLAITLTLFAFIRYGWKPLDLRPEALYLPLTLLIALSAGILFGEEFNIKRIKFSHGVMFLLLGAAVAMLLPYLALADSPAIATSGPLTSLQFASYLIPILVGFLTGPWLDLQQWQRAIQMHRERVSITTGFAIGGTLFFLLLCFHGMLGWASMSRGAAEFIRTGISGYSYAEQILIRFFFERADQHPWIFAAYATFVCVCILTTLDSGYVALRWYLRSNASASKNPILALIPEWVVTSPIPLFAIAGFFALLSAVLGLELEYFMIFYATFFVGYSALAIARAFMNSPASAIPHVKMLCVGSVAVVVFAYGYFLKYPIFQIAGSLLPLAYVIWMLVKPTSGEDFVRDQDELDSPAPESGPLRREDPAPGAQPAAQTMAAHAPAGYFDGKWFVHSFMATYADTNSVGNVYFGMYAMWVGKTRELFFNHVMPKFNLRNTPFYILTRSFEHKFVRETREFEQVSVRIRIASYNRKFVTLEHEIFDSAGSLLGKGKQTLLFVSSSDYHMIDMPADVQTAFITYV